MKRHLTVVVVGLGNFGSYMARTLARLGHTVIAIDKNEERVHAVGRDLAKAVTANVATKEIYREVGAGGADLAVVSLGERIDLSALATLHLKELGVKEIWVKVISEDQAQMMHMIGATNTIFPERDMAERLALGLHQPYITDRLKIADDFGILEFQLPEHLAGKSLIDLDLRRRFSVNVIALHDNETGESLLNFDPKQPLAEGEILYILGLLKNLERFQESFKT